MTDWYTVMRKNTPYRLFWRAGSTEFRKLLRYQASLDRLYVSATVAVPCCPSLSFWHLSSLSCLPLLFVPTENFTDATGLGNGEWEAQCGCLSPFPCPTFIFISLSVHPNTKQQHSPPTLCYLLTCSSTTPCSSHWQAAEGAAELVLTPLVLGITVHPCWGR